MNLLAAFLISISLLNGSVTPVEIPIVEDVEEIYEPIEDVVALHSWAEAYFEALVERLEFEREQEAEFFWFTSSILLMDINLDGIPEMFLISNNGIANFAVFTGFSYQDGEVIELNVFSDGAFSLLRNIETGEYAWIADGFRRIANGWHRWTYQFVDFSDLSNVQSGKTLMYERRLIWNEDYPSSYQAIWYRRSSWESYTEVSYEDIEVARTEFFTGFERIEVQTSHSVLRDFHIDNHASGWGSISAEDLSRNLVIAFFNEWE